MTSKRALTGVSILLVLATLPVANRFIAGTGAGTGWGTAALIETDDTGSGGSPQVAFDANGNALVVWSQFATNGNQLHNIWANRYQ